MVEVREQDGQDAPQTISLAGLSPEARAELTALEAKLRTQETETWLDRFKRRIWGVMKWAGIGAVAATATAGVLAGGVYVGKQAMDAFPQAVETAANREVKERVEVIKVAYEELNQAAFALLRTLYEFLLAVKEKATTWEGVSKAAGSLWQGIWDDGAEYLANGDSSPDQILGQIKSMVEDDPVLSQKLTEVFTSYDKLKTEKDEFEQAGKSAFDANDTDAKEFYEDYKKEFWNEMLQRGPRTK